MAAGRVNPIAGTYVRSKERETLVIETAHILSFGLFLCPQAFEKVSVDTGCKRKLTQNSFMQTG